MAQTVPERRADIRLGTTLKYHGNVAQSSDGALASRGLTKSDQSASPYVTADLLFPLGRNSVGLIGYVGYDFYRRNDRLNAERIRLDGTGSLAVSSCEIGLTAGIRRSQTDLGDVATLVASGISDVKNIETVQQYGASISCGAIVGIRPTASVMRTIANNSSDIRQISEYRSMSYSAGLEYRQPSIGTINLFGTYQTTDYPNRPILSGSTLRDDGYTQKIFGARYERDIGARMKGRVEVSHVDLNPRIGGTRDFGGLAWNADLTAVVNARMRLHGNVGREVTSSLNSDAEYQVTKNYGFDVDYAINQRFSVSGGFTHRARRYVYSLPPTPLTLSNDRRNSLFSSLTYSRNERLRLILSGGYDWRDANGGYYDFNAGFASLGVEISF